MKGHSHPALSHVAVRVIREQCPRTAALRESVDALRNTIKQLFPIFSVSAFSRVNYMFVRSNGEISLKLKVFLSVEK